MYSFADNSVNVTSLVTLAVKLMICSLLPILIVYFPSISLVTFTIKFPGYVVFSAFTVIVGVALNMLTFMVLFVALV